MACPFGWRQPTKSWFFRTDAKLISLQKKLGPPYKARCVIDTDNKECAAARAVIANKDRLTKADQDIGDGDHGVGMARGFAAFDQATAKEVRTLQ